MYLNSRVSAVFPPPAHRAGAEAEAVHRDRYLVAERLYIDEVDRIRLVNLVIDNSTFDRPRILLER
jgi:hypothetical protein